MSAQIACNQNTGKWKRGTGYYKSDSTMWKDCRNAPNPDKDYLCWPNPSNMAQVLCTPSFGTNTDNSRTIKVLDASPPIDPEYQRYSCNDAGKIVKDPDGEFSDAVVKAAKEENFDLCNGGLWSPYDDGGDDDGDDGNGDGGGW